MQPKSVLTSSMTFALHTLASFAAPAARHGGGKALRYFFRFGLAGLPIISAVDSSFVPLPLPGITDLMLIVYAAGKANPILLVFLSTLGSAAGGLFSHAVGRAGGMAFLEKHVPARILSRVTAWVEGHAILSVALPALLPPPMPLSPFVLVAGAVHMSRKKFMTAFTVSRFVRHALAVWIGIHYGRHVIHLWNQFSARWGTTILSVLWGFIILFTAIAIWRLYQASRDLKLDQAKPDGVVSA
jgi:membrane protein YqaA with SNARE-associated domain